VAWRGWLIESSIETQAGDASDLLPEQGGQKLDGGEAAVSDQHQLPLRHPTAGLQDQLPAPVGELLVAPPALAALPLREGKGCQEGQGPDPPVPRNSGPPVAGAPTRRGFGTRLLERGLPCDLGAGAAVELHFESGGLRASVRFAPRAASGR
jgi:hypothetical protein